MDTAVRTAEVDQPRAEVDSQFARATARASESCTEDPEAAVAPFNSAF
jgi:hypothetical protein